MQRVKRSTAVPALPAPPAGGTPGFFTGGDPQTSQAATVPGYEWFNGIQEELAYVIEQAGLVMSSADNTQLRAAILKMIQDAGKAVVIQNATFEASVANGEAVRWDAGNNLFDEAIADGTTNNQAVGFADVTNSKVYCYGETPALFAGLTPGARYYLDAATPGAITTAAPADKIPVGIAKSATTLFVDIDPAPAASVPVGSEMLWPTETPPSGWLEEDGSSLLRAGTYAGLFAVIGTTYGAADGTHFNLPDSRGRFPRIWAHGSVNDPDRAGRTIPGATGATMTAGDHVGTEQVDGFKSHQHNIPVRNTGGGSSGGIAKDDTIATFTTAIVSELAGGNETRPINTYRMLIIKY